MMTENQRLLAEYAQNGSEPAFQELVTRYINMVYSTALRLVEGDTHKAEDVTQAVFVNLALKAKTLQRESQLGGWLHRHCCFVASTVMRGERRRQHWEREAVEMNSLTDHSKAHMAELEPVLDEAINQLGEQDRRAILLRFFEQLDYRSIGTELGTNEDAARMKTNRALNKLYALLKRRGVTLSVTLLATTLAANAVSAAPPKLAAAVTGAAISNATIAGSSSIPILKTMIMTKLKSAIIAAIVIACVGTPFLIQHQIQLHRERLAVERAGPRLTFQVDTNGMLVMNGFNLGNPIVRDRIFKVIAFTGRKVEVVAPNSLDARQASNFNANMTAISKAGLFQPHTNGPSPYE